MFLDAVFFLVGAVLDLLWWAVLLAAIVQTLISFNVLALIPPAAVPVLAIVNFGAVLAIILGNTLWDTTVQQHVPQESLSRVNSYDWMVSLIFQPVAFAINSQGSFAAP